MAARQVERLVGRSAARTTNRQLERRSPGIVARQRPLERLERHVASASRDRTHGRCAGVGRGRRSSTAGIVRNSPVSAAYSASATAMFVASDIAAFWLSASLRGRKRSANPLPVADDLLLGELDPVGTARRLGDLDTARQLGERRRQIAGRDRRVGELRPVANHRPLDAVETDRAVLGDADDEHHGRLSVRPASRLPASSAMRGGWRPARPFGRYTVTPRFHASRSIGSPGRTNQPTSAIAYRRMTSSPAVSIANAWSRSVLPPDRA